MRCDQATGSELASRHPFQSLSGFLMRCDTRRPSTTSPETGFQSLSGFLMRCDHRQVVVVHQGRRVSIPIGFSDAL